MAHCQTRNCLLFIIRFRLLIYKYLGWFWLDDCIQTLSTFFMIEMCWCWLTLYREILEKNQRQWIGIWTCCLSFILGHLIDFFRLFAEYVSVSNWSISSSHLYKKNSPISVLQYEKLKYVFLRSSKLQNGVFHLQDNYFIMWWEKNDQSCNCF